MEQTAVASPRPVVTHHLDHPELLLLDNAVVRIAELYIAKHSLSDSQRGVLSEYQTDLATLAMDLAGPARDYADQVLELARTILDAQAVPTVEGAGGAHRAA